VEVCHMLLQRSANICYAMQCVFNNPSSLILMHPIVLSRLTFGESESSFSPFSWAVWIFPLFPQILRLIRDRYAMGWAHTTQPGILPLLIWRNRTWRAVEAPQWRCSMWEKRNRRADMLTVGTQHSSRGYSISIQRRDWRFRKCINTNGACGT
jgi:hypothetical protein